MVLAGRSRLWSWVPARVVRLLTSFFSAERRVLPLFRTCVFQRVQASLAIFFFNTSHLLKISSVVRGELVNSTREAVTKDLT